MSIRVSVTADIISSHRLSKLSVWFFNCFSAWFFRHPQHQPTHPVGAPPLVVVSQAGLHLVPRRAPPSHQPLNWVPPSQVEAVRLCLQPLARNLLDCPVWLVQNPDSVVLRSLRGGMETARARCLWNLLHPWLWGSSRSTVHRVVRIKGKAPLRREQALQAAPVQVREETEEAMEEVTGATGTAQNLQQGTKHRLPRSLSSMPWNVYN